MSRRGRGSSASKKVANGPPPSHPSETYRGHRIFLIRSLERNDVDMDALIELNKSLHTAKEKILQSCGELILLDLGSGRLKLINDELHEETAATDGGTAGGKNGTTTDAEIKAHQHGNQHHLTPTQKEVCVDFLLRMKLRRKLSNRLIRRLTRLARAMDGKDVYPPPAPKYGDLRLHIDPKSIESRHVEWKEKEDARKRILRAIDLDLLDSDNIGEISTEEKERENGFEERNPDGQPIGTGKNEKDLPEETQSADTPTQEHMDCSSVAGAENKSVDGGKKAGGQSKGSRNYYTSPTLLSDFKLLKEYDSAYEKTWDISTKSFKYVLANEEIGEPEYKQMTRGSGIGATSVFTSLDGLQAEHKRWQTNMLRRIQEQPTLDELGLRNRVFQFEERRKRCLEESVMDEEGGSSTTGESPIKKKGKIESEGDNKNVDHENETKSLKVKEKESGGAGEENSESDEDEEMERKDTNVDTVKPKRSISFAAIPSFHDHDLARIRMIHRELLNSSQAELTRKRLTDATNEYNQSHQLSTQLFDARQMVQHNLTFTIAKGRQELTKAHSDYTIAYTTAKQVWMKEKFEYDMKKSQAVLPTKWGSQPLGTEVIKKYMQNNCSNLQLTTVSQTLADIVDGSILAAEGKAPIQRFKDFVPPPAPGMNAQTGENMAQRQHRVEMEYRKQYNAIDVKFQKSEAERTRAWRKVMKSQAEINSVSGSNGRGVRITLSNYHQIPVPSIRTSTQQNLPSQYAQQSAKLASYTPPVSASATTLTDTSKYSAAKVKQRKSADGTVAPVSEPKKTKDGLYLRPAGRTRKGMQWDAVNGVWIPQRS